MGMLLRHRPDPDVLTTTKNFGVPETVEEKPIEKTEEKTKEEPKTVKRGRKPNH